MQMTSSERLIELIARQSGHEPGPELCALRDHLLERYGSPVQAILYYGSCLRSGDALDGLVDLYLIVDNYRAAYGKRLPAVFNRLLAPNVFYLELPVGEHTVRTKYAIVSRRDFDVGTSRRWFHSYLWARFAQPTGLLFVRDEATAQGLYADLAQAVVTFLARVLPRLPARFDAAEAWQTGFSLTYRAELRPERSNRPAQLFERYEGHFEVVTEAAIPAMPFALRREPGGRPFSYTVDIPTSTRRWSRLTWALRQVQGKLLSLLRLIKSVFTFQGGIDYAAWKLERHSGVHIEVTPRLRRHPLIFVWPLMWKLYRRGVFR